MTLHQLRTIYTLEDAMNMYEIIIVGRINEWLAMEHAKGQK